MYKSFYTLQNPAEQMRGFLTDALRSAIPVYTLDEVFAKKDDIARDVNETVASQMEGYGFQLVSTLITRIGLPREVEDSMNQINAAQRTMAAAQDLAGADRIKRVTEAKAEAEAMEESGKGSTVVLPSDFRESASMFEQMIAAKKGGEGSDAR